MKKFNVTGMSCAACSARVEKAVKNVEGVKSCSVSLLTNSMGVEGSASDDEIIKAVEEAGYGASSAESKSKKKEKNNLNTDDETKKILTRLIWSVILVLILMYAGMGHSMWGFPLPPFFEGNFLAVAIVQMLISGLVLVINQKFFISGIKGFIHRTPNMDTLVALGSGVSFGWSVWVLLKMTSCTGDAEQLMKLADDLYFESAAMILALITVGKTLEAKSKGKTTNALKALMNLSPETAVVIINGEEKIIAADEVKAGDIFVVKPGSQIPADGVVVEGDSAVNEAALTGESIPADKFEGSRVSAGTMNQSGFLKCRAEKSGNDTMLAQIIQMVSDVAATKAPIAKIADKVSGVFVPSVICIAIITAVVWLILGQSAGFALARGISVLVISCPCALGLATPVAIMVGSGVGARNGILFKTAESLETAGKTSIVVVDKTGTVTEGKPVVSEVVTADGITEDMLLQLALDVEKKSEHPLSKAIVEAAEGKNLSAADVKDFAAETGKGVRAVDTEGAVIAGGNISYIRSFVNITEEDGKKIMEGAEKAKTPVLFCKNDKFYGVLYIEDKIKDDSAEAINQLKKLGLRIVMLTGDNEKTAQAVAQKAGIEEVIAGVLPDQKEKVISDLKKQGMVLMAGDGINDAPALTAADSGMAMVSGTDVAIDAADVVLMNSSLSDVAAAVKLSRKTVTNIKENLFWAFIYNVIGIPLAAGVFIHLTGWELKPVYGAAAMSISSFCVVTNALRLNFIRFGKQPKTVVNKENKQKEFYMEKTIKIEGMMCEHCEAHVKKALEALAGVETAVPSHEKGTAVVSLKSDVSAEQLTKAVEEAGYKVLGIE